MSCDITAGRAKPCKKHIGGVRKMYLFNYLETPFTVVDGVATAMDVALTEAFEYDLVGDGQVLAESMASDRSAGSTTNTQTITAILQGIDAPTSNELKLVANGYPQAVIQSRDGNYHIAGFTDGVDFTVEETTGTTQAEFSGYTLTGTAIESALSPIMDEATRDAFLAIVAVNP